ncbi:MAG: TetR/AcrR family transcriptional regulator [Chloroflexi bacterium]|nr:TetR/AcrR family transcriptional regulator [Chloroflexota bacterium]
MDERSDGAARRTAQRLDTRSRLLGAARELIPMAELSLPVTAIARHAGVAIQTVYDQFGSKGGLLIALVDDIQRSTGLFDAFREVFRSPDGETAMRRMIAATVSFWGQAWPYVEYLLRSRRVDPVVSREMDYIDRLRHAHYWAIAERLRQEGRLMPSLTSESAADQAFALTTPTVYEELAVRRGSGAEAAIDTITRAVLGVILDPNAAAARISPPDWAALESAAAERARAAGADPERLSPAWRSTEPAEARDRGRQPNP